MTPGPGYSNVLFADGFESGDLSNWNGLLGNGGATVVGAAAHAGSNGLRISNTSGQFQVAVKALASPVADSSASFWVRLNSGSGLQTLAEARDGSSSMHIWDLYYDWNRQGLVLDAYKATGADEVFTGLASVLPGGWVKIAVQYTATSTGGARVYINDATRPDWMTTGDYTRSANLQRIQLWNDAVGSTDFDDVRIATPPPPGAVVRAGAGQRRRTHLERAELGRRQPDQQLPDSAAAGQRRHARPDLHGLRQHQLHGHRPHKRDRVHVHGRGDQRGRHGPELQLLGRRDPDRGDRARRSDGRNCVAG